MSWQLLPSGVPPAPISLAEGPNDLFMHYGTDMEQ